MNTLSHGSLKGLKVRAHAISGQLLKTMPSFEVQIFHTRSKPWGVVIVKLKFR